MALFRLERDCLGFVRANFERCFVEIGVPQASSATAERIGLVGDAHDVPGELSVTIKILKYSQRVTAPIKLLKCQLSGNAR